MKLIEFTFDRHSIVNESTDIAASARNALTRLLDKGIGQRSAANTVIDFLHNRGIEYSRAVEVVLDVLKTTFKSDITKESILWESYV